MESLQDKFLIATPQMPDPRFQEQVVYICSHNEDGAMGLVINRPSDHSLDAVLKSANIPVPEQLLPPIYIGGPVDIESAFFLYSSEYKVEHFMVINQSVSMSREPKILHDIAQGNGPRDYLFVLGYAGWAPGQLEMELTVNGWLALPASYDILFHTSDELKWSKAAESCGIDIALFSDEIGLA